MKTKHLIFAVIAIMLLTLLGTTTVNAENGPGDWGSIGIYNMEEWHVIYSKEYPGDMEEVEGISYDLATNTLTLNNLNKPGFDLDINEMGEDFKLKLVGENNLAMIGVSTYEYAGNLTITGDGVLNIDTADFGILYVSEGEECNGISFYAATNSPKLIIENTATVNIKAQSNVISINDTSATNGNSLIVLQNGQAVTITKSDYTYVTCEEVVGLMYEPNGYSQTYALYEKNGKTYGKPDYGDDQVYITDYEIRYDEHADLYFADPTANELMSNIPYESEEALLADGYVAKNQIVTVDVWANTSGESGYGISSDANGKKYLKWTMYDSETDSVTYVLYEMSDYEITLADGRAYRVFTKNPTADPESVTEVLKEVKTGTFTYKVALKELSILPGDQTLEVIAKEESVALEVPVEAAEQNPEDVAASGEVGKIVNEVLAKDSGTVEGIDEELAEKIREKAEAGETILVAVVTEEVKAEDVKEDAEKAEEKVEGTNLKIVAFYDIDVLVKTATEELGNVTKLGDKITLAVPVPTGLPAVPAGYTRTFKIIRVHNGVAEEIEATVDGDKLVFLSDVFSTYAVAYEDTKTTNNPSTGDNIVLYITLFSIAVVGLVFVKKFLKK